MLNIFRGKTESPNYRLIAPPDGELQSITVDQEVRPLHTSDYPRSLTTCSDFSDKTICIRCYLAKYQIYPGTVRVLHRPAGQAPPESCAAADTGRYWYPRFRLGQRPFYIRSVTSRTNHIQAAESVKGDGWCGIDEVLRGKQRQGTRVTLLLMTKYRMTEILVDIYQ